MADHERSHLHARPVRRVHESRHHPQLIRLRQIPESAQDVAGRVERMSDDTAEDLPERVQPVLKPGRNAEVAAPSTERPEQVWIGPVCDVEHISRRGHQLDRQQVVHREAVHAVQPPEPAAERQPSDAGRRDYPAGRRKPMEGSLPV